MPKGRQGTGMRRWEGSGTRQAGGGGHGGQCLGRVAGGTAGARAAEAVGRGEGQPGRGGETPPSIDGDGARAADHVGQHAGLPFRTPLGTLW